MTEQHQPMSPPGPACDGFPIPPMTPGVHPADDLAHHPNVISGQISPALAQDVQDLLAGRSPGLLGDALGVRAR